ncbi:MAG: hypothetical protein ACKOGI_09605 [Vulcanococcus sp.]
MPAPVNQRSPLATPTGPQFPKSTSLEQAYAAVEQAYGEGDYRMALDMAEEGLQQAGTTKTDQPATPWLDALRSSKGRALGGSEPSATAPTTPATTPRQQKAPDPYDQGLLVLSLQGRPRELDLP